MGDVGDLFETGAQGHVDAQVGEQRSGARPGCQHDDITCELLALLADEPDPAAGQLHLADVEADEQSAARFLEQATLRLQ